LSRGDEIRQLGVAPNRIDLLREAAPLAFGDAWERRVEGTYGRARACWIGLEDLLAIKERIEKRPVKKAPLAPEILRVAEDDDGWPGREATTLGQAAARRR
jgi:hypothetical protein